MAQITAVLPAPTLPQRGFTLVELAVVLFVVSLLLSGMFLPLSAQQDIRARNETDRLINEAREALLSYAAVNERLPCPASSTSSGRESPEGGGVCTNPYDGFLPAATLGLISSANDGYYYDGWSNDTAHRIRYAVTTAQNSAFTSNNVTASMRRIGIGSAFAGDLIVCNTGVDITATACKASANTLTENAVVVMFSLGKNAPGGLSADEAPNFNNTDNMFVNAATGANFDDTLIWLSPNTLVGRMVSAGRLP